MLQFHPADTRQTSSKKKKRKGKGPKKDWDRKSLGIDSITLGQSLVRTDTQRRGQTAGVEASSIGKGKGMPEERAIPTITSSAPYPRECWVHGNAFTHQAHEYHCAGPTRLPRALPVILGSMYLRTSRIDVRAKHTKLALRMHEGVGDAHYARRPRPPRRRPLGTPACDTPPTLLLHTHVLPRKLAPPCVPRTTGFGSAHLPLSTPRPCGPNALTQTTVPRTQRASAHNEQIPPPPPAPAPAHLAAERAPTPAFAPSHCAAGRVPDRAFIHQRARLSLQLLRPAHAAHPQPDPPSQAGASPARPRTWARIAHRHPPPHSLREDEADPVSHRPRLSQRTEIGMGEG
ncbi:hypothetical protein DFH06DRAFT_1479469 [Mycena polygramma]|nr:hypothetical protein DFH06DRAFT_1479469 [Mycena polygramma]